MKPIQLPPHFLFGAATSSYQIEGGWNEDGKGESIWDRFSHTPGNIIDSSNGDIACDHYHRWPQDIALMKDLGLQAYRFSTAWARILPRGRGLVNPAGLDFYSRLVDGLLEAGITPFVTLYHWDLPQTLQDEGGWTVRSTAEAFVEYTEAITAKLGDRVTNWITHNEPWCASFLSYHIGEHAPGWHDERAALQAAHHILLSHGWAVPVIRRNSPGAQVGITLNLSPSEPASPSAADYQATRSFDGHFNRWFLDPLYGREYPADKVTEYTATGVLPEGLILPGDFTAISAPTDFLGVNYYSRSIHRANLPEEQNLPINNSLAPASEWTDMGWEVYPQGLYNLLCRLHFDYQIPKLYVTENGASYGDAPDENGQVNDTRRIAYFEAHLQQCQRAITAGVPLAGYFAWSLMDNFEWARGYPQRFGMVWVDYATQQRIPKASALWYRDMMITQGAKKES